MALCHKRKKKEEEEDSQKGSSVDSSYATVSHSRQEVQLVASTINTGGCCVHVIEDSPLKHPPMFRIFTKISQFA